MTGTLLFAHIGLWVAVIVQGLAICALLYKTSRLAEVAAVGGVAGNHLVGIAAPSFTAKDLRSGAVVSNDQFVGSPTLLLFLSPACPTCRRLMRGLAGAWKTGMFGVDRLLAYCEGSAGGCVAYARDFENVDAITFLGEHDARVSDLFRIRRLPALVEVDQEWRIAACGYPGTWDDVVHALGARNGARESS